MARIRYHVAPRDAPPAIAARALGLTLEEFSAPLPALLGRRFPPADLPTGHYDLKASIAGKMDGTRGYSQTAHQPRQSRRKMLARSFVSGCATLAAPRQRNLCEHCGLPPRARLPLSIQGLTEAAHYLHQTANGADDNAAYD